MIVTQVTADSVEYLDVYGGTSIFRRVANRKAWEQDIEFGRLRPAEGA